MSNISYKQYKNALDIIKAFNENKEKIRSIRRQYKYCHLYDIEDIIWLQRINLNKEEYLYRNFIEKKLLKDYQIEIILKIISDLKLKLLELRLSYYRNLKYYLVLNKKNNIVSILKSSLNNDKIENEYMIISEHKNKIDANIALEQYKYNKYIDSIIISLG